MRWNKKMIARAAALGLCMAVLILLAWITYARYFSLPNSDMRSHMLRALAGGGYSLNSVLYRFFGLFGTDTAYILYNLLLLLGTVFAAAFAARKYSALQYGQTFAPGHFLPLSLSLLFLCTLYIPGAYPWFYRNRDCAACSSLITQPWQSDTYNLMRLFAIGALTAACLLKSRYREKFPWLTAGVFTVTLILANYAKPSFVVCFAPALLVFLIRDFLRDRGRTVGKQVLFGLCVLISLPILLLQYDVLYGEETGSGIVVTFSRILSGTPVDWLMVTVSGLAVPILFSVVLLRRKQWEEQLSMIWLAYAVSLVIRLFFAETGYRASQNNFAWGTMVCAYLLYLFLLLRLHSAYHGGKLSGRTYALLMNAYGLNVVCGILYFLRISITGVIRL